MAIITKKDIISGLRNLGILEGHIVCVHTAMSKIGYIVGGARAVVEALIEVVGPEGTVMMPAFSGDVSDPVEWSSPPVPELLLGEIRKNQILLFDKKRTPTCGMGTTAEYFRRYPGVVRSDHPMASFCAYGTHAVWLTRNHSLGDRFGSDSPVGKLYKAGGYVVLIGAHYLSVTALYYAMTQVSKTARISRSYPLDISHSGLVWQNVNDIVVNSEWFPLFIKQLEPGIIQHGFVGAAHCARISLRDVIPRAITWLNKQSA